MKRILMALPLILIFAIQAPTALAADSNASCTGLGLSDHASAGEMPDVLKEITSLLGENGLNPGAFISAFSKVHAGTHAPGCEEAAEEIIGGLLGGD